MYTYIYKYILIHIYIYVNTNIYTYVYKGIPDRLYIPIDYILNVARCAAVPKPRAAPAAAAAWKRLFVCW